MTLIQILADFRLMQNQKKEDKELTSFPPFSLRLTFTI
jgi:hypothetical protein